MRVAGLDLSLRGAAAVVLPEDWGLDWRVVPRVTVGHALNRGASEADRLGRLTRIRLELVEFLRVFEATHVFVEEYAFSRKKSQAHALGELGGVIKLAVLEDLALPVRTCTASAARVLLGKMPRGDAKVAAHLALFRAGAPHDWTADELDAFAVANWGLAELGSRNAMILEAAS